MADWGEIRKDWDEGNLSLREIAEKHGVNLNTLKTRKRREGWPVRNEWMVGNQNGKGNRGNPNPVSKFPQRNAVAKKHGFYSRYIPQETLDLMQEAGEDDPASMLWMSIRLQYAAIIRAQQVMFVEDRDDHSAILKKERETGHGSEQEYEVQFSHEKYAAFLNAQSRAMSELRANIKQYLELETDSEERRLRLELMKKQIEKVDYSIMNPNSASEEKLMQYFEALGHTFRQVTILNDLEN